MALESGRLRHVLAAVVGALACQVGMAASLVLQVVDEQGTAVENAAVALKPMGAAAPFKPGKAEIVQQGTHDELVAVDGLYRRFVVERQQAAGWKV